jgi:hypothetical protein
MQGKLMPSAAFDACKKPIKPSERSKRKLLKTFYLVNYYLSIKYYLFNLYLNKISNLSDPL